MEKTLTAMQELIDFINDMKVNQTLLNGNEIETIHTPSLLHKANELLEKEKQYFRFTEFAGERFWLNEDSGLWESFTEGTEFEVNGEMQFRFTTEELYQVFLSTILQ